MLVLVVVLRPPGATRPLQGPCMGAGTKLTVIGALRSTQAGSTHEVEERVTEPRQDALAAPRALPIACGRGTQPSGSSRVGNNGPEHQLYSRLLGAA